MFKLWDRVLHKGHQATVTATSGTDNQAIVRWEGGYVTRWISQDELTPIPNKEEENKKETTDAP